ncbi:MAG: hypothetical protein LUE08_06945 [Akkermansiaceae bacterium]|nr:hypothetical protein [Akkermansiaceae bacterium]
MNAVESMLAKMPRSDSWDSLDAVLSRDGVAFFSPRIVYLGVPLAEDMAGVPAEVRDGPGERGLVVLMIAGDMRFLPEHFCHYRSLGFTHLIWQRGYKPGTKRWRRASIDDFQRKFEACSKI